MTDERPPLDITCMAEAHDTEEKTVIRRSVTKGTVNNAVAMGRFSNHLAFVDVNDCVEILHQSNKDIDMHDTDNLQAMLGAQAHTLNTIFTSMAIRAADNVNGYLNASEKFMRMALKAQSQCKSTIEALHEIQNRRPYIQNNKAINQQVNNGTVRDAGNQPDQYAQAGGRTQETTKTQTNYWSITVTKNNGWTPERRKKQAEMIKTWQPWTKSTGAKTPLGKAAVSQNALKHGAYSQDMKDLMRSMREQSHMVRDIDI